MKYAVFYSLQAPAKFKVTPQQVYAEALDQIVRAEEVGISPVRLTEHHFGITRRGDHSTSGKPITGYRRLNDTL